jgi:hypothetical protein
MAGVGRRGFAAAARAAMFATGVGHAGAAWNNGSPAEVSDSLRTNAPKYLDINTATAYRESLFMLMHK